MGKQSRLKWDQIIIHWEGVFVQRINVMKNDENNLKALCQKLGVDVIGGYFHIGIVKQYRGVQFLKKPLLTQIGAGVMALVTL